MSLKKSRKLIGPNQSKLLSTFTLPLPMLPLLPLLLAPYCTEPSAATDSWVDALARMVRSVCPMAVQANHSIEPRRTVSVNELLRDKLVRPIAQQLPVRVP